MTEFTMYDAFQIRQLCNVRYRKFDFARYPSHVRKLKTYAFKPIIVHVSESLCICLCLCCFLIISRKKWQVHL